MKKYHNHTYTAIENYAEKNNYEITEYGPDIIGENFLILKHNDKDITISFVLSGTSGENFIYECIYSDLN
ncbi:MAG: hypothetical protein KAT68_19555 [Bacteroidales bacterium]|nr:hypothetical protein [Bacteroidales bacterium]